VGREWDSSAYHQLSDPQFGWALKVIKRLDALGLSAPEQILDAGCGTGRVTAELLRKFPHSRVLAVDASENMVRQARHTLQKFGNRVAVEQRDLLDLPFSNAFDLIFSTAVFHWIKDHERLFSVLYRALKPGGLLFAQCGGGPNLKKLRDRIQQLVATEKFRPYFKDWQRVWEYPGPESTAERLKKSGFTEVFCSLEEAGVRFGEEKGYTDFVVAMILHPYLERLPESLHVEFTHELVRQASLDQPSFVLDYWRLNLQGRKPD
jgi:trans-aconitate 2-methyltransferase